MQVLVRAIRNVILTMLFGASISSCFSQEVCDIESVKTQDIMVCAQLTYGKVDNVLNEQYKSLINTLDQSQRERFKAVQVSWIKLKDSYCEHVYRTTYPGAEAPIDKLSCATNLTAARISELLFFRTGVLFDGYYKTAGVVGDGEWKKKLGEYNPISASNKVLNAVWREYAEGNCALALDWFEEEKQDCMARMNFNLN